MGRLPVNIRLDVSRHCIETEAKRLYNRSVARYFKASRDKNALERRIEVLKKALERFDFPTLRSRYPLLAGCHDQDVFLVEDDGGNLYIITPEEEIRP